MIAETDILDDPRYDKTPGPLSVAVSRSPTVTRFSRRKILRLIGLPHDATWEQANPVLKERIVRARNAGDDEAATQWSVIRDELEGKLARRCECGAIISSGATKCQVCSNHTSNGGRRKHGWWRHNPALISKLGKCSDTAIATMFHIHRNTIGQVRRSLSIRPYDCFPNEPYTGKRRAWPDAILSKLGTVPDSSIARQYGLSRHMVFDERKSRKIAPFRPRARREFKSKFRRLMGTMSDADLSRLSGTPRPIITYFRNKKGIPPFVRCEWRAAA